VGPALRNGRRYSTTAVPVRRVVVKKSTQRPTARDGTVAWLSETVLRVARKAKRQKDSEVREGKRRQGGTSEGLLALDGAGVGVFIRSADKYAMNDELRSRVRGSNE